jgi:hypothetical protein
MLYTPSVFSNIFAVLVKVSWSPTRVRVGLREDLETLMLNSNLYGVATNYLAGDYLLCRSMDRN